MIRIIAKLSMIALVCILACLSIASKQPTRAELVNLILSARKTGSNSKLDIFKSLSPRPYDLVNPFENKILKDQTIDTQGQLIYVWRLWNDDAAVDAVYSQGLAYFRRRPGSVVNETIATGVIVNMHQNPLVRRVERTNWESALEVALGLDVLAHRLSSRYGPPQGLSEENKARSARMFGRALFDKRSDIGNMAAVLGDRFGPTMLPYGVRAARSKNIEIATRGVRLLRRMPSDTSRKTLAELAASSSKRVSRLARQALAEMEKK